MGGLPLLPQVAAGCRCSDVTIATQRVGAAGWVLIDIYVAKGDPGTTGALSNYLRYTWLWGEWEAMLVC